MLNDDDLNRYARQVIIPNFDEEGQEKLLRTTCLIIGAGAAPWTYLERNAEVQYH